MAAIHAHHVLHGSAAFETEAPHAREMARRHAALLDGGYPYLVVEEDREVSGYAYASAQPPRAAYRNTVENSIFLRLDAIGFGLRSLLLATLIETCEASSFRLMVALIGDSANLASIRLHERHGFRRIGTLEAVGHEHGRWLNIVLMQRRLGPGASSEPQARSV